MNDDIRNAVAVMKRGGVIAYPTDTVWGLGCDATCPEAVARVYAIKRRVDSKALITLVDSLAMLERRVDSIPDVAYQLIDAAVNPLTIVYDSADGLAPNLLAPDGSVGVRLTSDPFCRELCRAMGCPVVSTSANISGEPSPATFPQISREILDAVDYVVKWRRDDLSVRPPSTVIKLTRDARIKILRP